MKIIYLIAALALLVGMLPVTAVPAGAQTTPSLQMYIQNPLTGAFDVLDNGHNVTGSVVRVTPLNLGGATVTAWSITPYTSQATFVGTPVIGAEGTAYALVSGGIGEATITAQLSAGAPISIDKKWAQIFETIITGNQSVPVTWNEGAKVFRATVTITDTVTGDFINKDGAHIGANNLPINPYPPSGYVPRPPMQGVILNVYLVSGSALVPMAPGLSATLNSVIGALPRATFTSLQPIPPSGTPLVTFGQYVTNAEGKVVLTLNAAGEEAVQVVVVPQYPATGLQVPVVPEVTTINFWTREMEKVPQVRWAGEKIVLEKNWGPGYAGRLVRFALENQSPGALEGFGPVPAIAGLNLTNTAQTVWTVVGETGLSSCILVSEDMGEVDVDAALYGTDNVTIWNQHGFVVFYLKFESITLGNVIGKRTGHITGLWTPPNPWDPSGTYVTPATPDNMTSETLNVSEDALLRARVRGWFTNSNPSVRPARNVDYNNSTLNNPTSANLNFPAGRWILPDDWVTLAGPNWKETRLHYDIMNSPSDGASGVTAINPLGPYFTAKTPFVLGSPYYDKQVSGTPVTGPFSPGIEDMTPLGWSITITKPDAKRIMWTVVPDGKLNTVADASNPIGGVVMAWDAPMPPAKIFFEIMAGTPVTLTGGVVTNPNQAGFFKAANKAQIYYLPAVKDTSVTPPVEIIPMRYTNPFYQEMIPAHEAIPAFINNGGYDWASFGFDNTIPAYGPYVFWTIINRPSVGAPVPSSDWANHPTKVQVYSDNHGEAMVFINGNWNLDLTQFNSNGAADVMFGATVGQATIEAMADYPYLRKHQAIKSNTIIKVFTWGGEVLGADLNGHAFPPNAQFRTGITPRMVLTTGTYTITGGTFPNQVGTSNKKMLFIWVTDRDTSQAGVLGGRVEWNISTMSGSPPVISGITADGVDAYNEVTLALQLEQGFLKGTNGTVVGSGNGTQLVSYLIAPQDTTKNKVLTSGPYTGKTVLEALFYKFYNSTMAASGPNPDNYAVAAIEVLQVGGPNAFNVNEKITAPDFGLVPGAMGTVIYNTNADFSQSDPIDDMQRFGDANVDGSVNMGDVTKIERIILGLDIANCNADANGNNSIDMGDVVKVERMILGLP